VCLWFTPFTIASQGLKELLKGHYSNRLRRVSCPGREVWVATHDNEPFERKILELELVEDIGLVFIERIVAQKKLASHEDRELKYRVEPGGYFCDYFGGGTRM